jgi:type I restriction enzyme, S subunit
VKPKLVPFLDVFEDVTGGNMKTPQSEFLAEGDIPVVDQGQGLIAGYVTDESRVCNAKPPVIVFGDHKRIIKYVDFRFAMGADGTKVLSPRNGDHPKYLFHALQAIPIPSAGYSRHYKFLKKTEIPLPPLAEQKRIAGILDAADALRAKRREALDQLDTLLQATFLDLFGDPVTNPKGWDLKKLGDECDVRDGTHDSPKYVNDGFPLLTSKNFKEGTVSFEGAALISAEDFQQINKRSKVDVGDLVMPMIGTIGNPVLIKHDPKFAIKNVALIKFTPTSPDNRFVANLLGSHYFDHITSGANRGGTQKFVALKDLRGLPIPVPPRDLQNRFASVVECVDRQRVVHTAHLVELDTLFASLQSRAFRGDL